MKKYLFFAASALALASCSSDDFLGENPGNDSKTSEITFGGNAGQITRGLLEKDKAAEKLKNNFIVYGYKTVGETKSTVYDHYNVNWKEFSSAGSTLSNTAGWEYVGQNINETLNESKGSQTIKYWDYAASQYDFIAFSFGTATQGTGDGKVEATRVTNTPSYTLKGSVDELAKCYIADRATARKTVNDKKDYKLFAYQDQINFNFRSLSTKVRLGIYETVPGYSVKSVKFYESDADNAGSDKPTLYTNENGENAGIASGKGTMTVTFGSNDANAEDFNQAKLAWEGEKANAKNIQFGELSKAAAEDKEAAGDNYIARTADKPSLPKEYNTVVAGTKVGDLHLKVDYVLVSTDGSSEEITVHGANAVVPAEYTNWQPNYAYTYIFKISDNTNGSTNPDDPAGLYPITFNAVVTETETGKQETITEVATPSITTYSAGAIENDEYKAGSDIYISVYDNNANALAALNVTGENVNSALYTASLAVPTKGSITESLVSLCLKNQTGAGPWTLANNGNQLTVTSATDLSATTVIPAAATINGNTITGKFAKFTPAAGTYVFQYTYKVTENNSEVTKKAYKVIKVVAPAQGQD